MRIAREKNPLLSFKAALPGMRDKGIGLKGDVVKKPDAKQRSSGRCCEGKKKKIKKAKWSFRQLGRK